MMAKENIEEENEKQTNRGEWKDAAHVYWQICDVLQLNQADMLISKYRSKFNVDENIKLFGR